MLFIVFGLELKLTTAWSLTIFFASIWRKHNVHCLCPVLFYSNAVSLSLVALSAVQTPHVTPCIASTYSPDPWYLHSTHFLHIYAIIKVEMKQNFYKVWSVFDLSHFKVVTTDIRSTEDLVLF